MTETIQIEHLRLTRLLVSHLEKNRGTRTGGVSIDYSVSVHRDNSSVYRLEMNVRSEPEIRDGCPISPLVEADVTGVFSFPEGMDLEKKEKLIRYNGGMILYGLLRGQLAAFSGSFPTGPFMLPSVDMAEVVKHIEQRRLKEQGSSGANRAKAGRTKKRSPSQKSTTSRRTAAGGRSSR